VLASLLFKAIKIIIKWDDNFRKWDIMREPNNISKHKTDIFIQNTHLNPYFVLGGRKKGVHITFVFA